MKKWIDNCKNVVEGTVAVFKDNKKTVLTDALYGAVAFGLFSIGNIAIGYCKACEDHGFGED